MSTDDFFLPAVTGAEEISLPGVPVLTSQGAGEHQPARAGNGAN
jgi:hypothetical protein